MVSGVSSAVDPVENSTTVRVDEASQQQLRVLVKGDTLLPWRELDAAPMFHAGTVLRT
jgi:hypothetical protein